MHCGPGGGDLRLAGWLENVGCPVAIDGPADPVSRPTPAVLTVLCWNLWIGRGRLADIVARIREGEYAGLGVLPTAPLIILAQEAYRADGSVPERSNGHTPRDAGGRARRRYDIVETARTLGMHLRYAPSMRNDGERSDRGNAILSTLPLHDAGVLELPFVLQRRAGVAAAVEVMAGGVNRRLRMVSAHLDHRGPLGRRWLGAASRALQTEHLLPMIDDDAIIIGADLNLHRGRRERSWRLFTEAGFTFGVPATVPAWRHTYHPLPRLMLDYLLFRDRNGIVATATVHRLDEDPRDRGSDVFGSDHHPLLARVELT